MTLPNIRPFTAEEDAQLRAQIGHTPITVLAKDMGRHRDTLHRRAVRLGLITDGAHEPAYAASRDDGTRRATLRLEQRLREVAALRGVPMRHSLEGRA